LQYRHRSLTPQLAFNLYSIEPGTGEAFQGYAPYQQIHFSISAQNEPMLVNFELIRTSYKLPPSGVG